MFGNTGMMLMQLCNGIFHLTIGTVLLFILTLGKAGCLILEWSKKIAGGDLIM